MNELLRQATELVGSEARVAWPCHGQYPCMYSSEVIKVIDGYQDLVRRLMHSLAGCAIELGRLDDRRVGKEVMGILGEAMESIPAEDLHE